MTKRKFFAAARSFIHANLMHKRFNETESKFDIRDFNAYFVDPQGIYFSLWYALLYNVLEFLTIEKAIPPNISKEVDAIYHPLRRFRNAILHTPPKYFDKRFDFILSQKAFKKILSIHFGLSKYFDEELAKYGETAELSPETK